MIKWFTANKLSLYLEEMNIIKLITNIYPQYKFFAITKYIQGVPGGKDLTSGECSLGQTIPI
jgi:hypothetical protein